MNTEGKITEAHFNSKVIIEEIKSLRLLVYKMREEMLAIQADGPKPERVVSPKEAALKLGVSTSTLWVICEQDDFPVKIQMTERRCGWKNSDLEAYIDSKRTIIR